MWNHPKQNLIGHAIEIFAIIFPWYLLPLKFELYKCKVRLIKGSSKVEPSEGLIIKPMAKGFIERED
jgi:hypothetical protein